jgi:hypothetical protein
MAKQVWSFAAPEDELIDDLRASSPVSMPDHSMAEYQEGVNPRIAARADARPVSEDISMADVYDKSDAFEGEMSRKAGKKGR